MDKSLLDFLGGVYIALLGILSVIFHKYLGEKMTLFQKKIFRFSLPVRVSQFSYLLCGIAFFVFGLLLIFGVIKTVR